MSKSATLAPPISTKDQEREEERIRHATHAIRKIAEMGALGVILVDAPFLAEIEKRHGRRAQRTSQKTLAELVERYFQSYLHPGDIVTEVDPGADEVVVFFFRARHDRKFFVDQFPGFPETLSAYLFDNRSKFGHSGDMPIDDVAVGRAFLFHDPSVRKERELSAVVDLARQDAALMRAQQERDRSQQFCEMVLSKKTRSVYQKIVDLESRDLYGFEALARGPKESPWASPVRMFEMAQKCGLLFELDALCRLAALRGASGKLPAGKKLFLNCSARVMDDPRFRHDQLRQALETCGLEPKDLVFEFSEHECVRSPKAVRETRETLRSLGVQVALDDAGAASPSLGAVLELDPDYVKIDIGLVRSVDTDIGRQELMQLIQGVAEKLGAKIIAEGVETADEVATLQRIGITLGQGYLLGMPDSLA